MSASPIIALRKAIHTALAGDAALTALVGGNRIFDEAPREARPPYVCFGDAQARDWSTATRTGCEQFAVLHVWSAQRGAQEALAIAARIAQVLDEAALTLDGHHLVDLRFMTTETRREAAGRFTRSSLRFRATTEQL